jgi:enoyl-CoA hydratase
VDGGTQRLPQIVGLSNAFYLIETGVEIDTAHALRIGLVQEAVPEGQALSRALELAGSIATYPGVSLRNDRRCVYDGLSLPLSEGLKLERELHRESLADPAMAAAVQRYAAGQRPEPPRPPQS